MPNRLGPLEFTEAEWVIGDPDGDHVRLRVDGLSHWVKGVETRQLPWSRVMEIGLSVQPLRRDHSQRLRKAAVILSWLGAPTGHVGQPACVYVQARRPYEGWSADFTHHVHRYPRREIAAASKLLSALVANGQVAKLGDPVWLSAVIRELARFQYGSRARFPRKQAIRAALEACSNHRE
ncbi:hypothetical protein [Streptomyces sp. NPDC058441]|uniref:hypothetical protein n=1 Tax=Streptomyces sp. NPDC058441 TaxID=3346502 RepID=UPI00365A416F